MAKTSSKKKETSNGRVARAIGSLYLGNVAAGGAVYRHLFTRDKKHTPVNVPLIKSLISTSRTNRKSRIELVKQAYKQSRGIALKPSYYRYLKQDAGGVGPHMNKHMFGHIRKTRGDFRSFLKSSAVIGTGFYGYGKYKQYKANKRGK